METIIGAIRKWAAVLFILCTISAQAASSQAQTPSPNAIPTIIGFSSTVVTVRLPDLEANGVDTVLSWNVAHMSDDMVLTMDFYRGNRWEPMAANSDSASIPAIGSVSLRIAHPRSFAPPTFRLQLWQGTQILDERMLVIPYEVPPSMARFTSSVTPGEAPSVSLDGIPRIIFFDRDEASNVDHLVVTWQIEGRAPGSNLEIDQLVDDETVINVEPPRDQLWLPSIGAMPVSITPPADGAPLRLRLRVIDLQTGLIYDESVLTLQADGSLPATQTPLPITGIPPTVIVVPSGSLNLPTSTGIENAPTLPAPPTIAGQPTNTPAPTVPPPRILDFHADPSSINLGGYTRLTWAVEDAATIEIQEMGADGVPGLLYIQLPAQGSLQIQLGATVHLMRYVLTARSASGESVQAEIVVNAG